MADNRQSLSDLADLTAAKAEPAAAPAAAPAADAPAADAAAPATDAPAASGDGQRSGGRRGREEENLNPNGVATQGPQIAAILRELQEDIDVPGGLSDGLPDLTPGTPLPVLRRLVAAGTTIHDHEKAL